VLVDLDTVIADLAAVDVHGLSEPALLVHTERVLEVQNRLDAIPGCSLSSSKLICPALNAAATTGNNGRCRATHIRCRDLRIRTGADESAEAATQRKYASRYVSLNSTFEGMLHLDGMLDPESAATSTAALTPLLEVNLGAEDERGTTQSTALTTKGLQRFVR
jgi:hypothetical protein